MISRVRVRGTRMPLAKEEPTTKALPPKLFFQTSWHGPKPALGEAFVVVLECLFATKLSFGSSALSILNGHEPFWTQSWRWNVGSSMTEFRPFKWNVHFPVEHARKNSSKEDDFNEMIFVLKFIVTIQRGGFYVAFFMHKQDLCSIILR